MRKPEIWVIDSSIRRRCVVASHLGSLGYSAYPIDPSERLPRWNGRDIIALVNDDEQVIERLLDTRKVLPLSCVVYADGMRAKRAAELVRRGVTELVEWPLIEGELSDAISAAEAYLGSLVDDHWRSSTAWARIESASPREKEILGCVLAGNTNREIGVKLGISARTVEVHRLNCFRRLGVKKTVDAVRLALDSGWFKHSVEI